MDRIPSSKPIDGDQPSERSFVTSSTLRGVPSGLPMSNASSAAGYTMSRTGSASVRMLQSWPVPTLMWSDLSNPYVWLVMLSTLAFGAIGFTDDYIKVVHRENQGLTARAKLGLQFVVSAAVAASLVVM